LCERHSDAASRERTFKMQLFTDEAASPHQNAGPAVLAGEEEKRKGKKCPKTKWMPGALHISQANIALFIKAIVWRKS
jgi:hypothetical protein